MDVQAVLAEYVEPVSADELAARAGLIDDHLRRVTEVASSRDFVDLRLAGSVAGVLTALLEDIASYTARERALLAGAIRYFTDHDDVTGDLTSPTGFEDDAEILNAVCEFLGRPDLVVDVD